MGSVLRNPLLPGFYPDPSICAKDGDFYLAASSFEYFPGVPLFHSRDLVHWRPLGHALDRPSQLPLAGVLPSKGIYASTIRYHAASGRFFLVTTLVKDSAYWSNVNFFVTAASPEGPWSDPVVIQGTEGIDPTIFFDLDGRAYYLGNRRPHPEDPSCRSREIWLQQLDLDSGRLTGERFTLLTDGALRGAPTPEGPHLYYKDGFYYLLIAEGGTDFNHACTVFRSRSLTGPYESAPRNPVMTHRARSHRQPITCTGHADLIQLPNGEWWAVLLACRPDRDDLRHLGRETFAVPVIWEDGWPVFSPDTGAVEFSYPAPALPAHPWPAEPERQIFSGSSLGPAWQCLRTPEQPLYSLTQRPSYLRLLLNRHTLDQPETPALLCRRQQHHSFWAAAEMEYVPAGPDEGCGLAVLIDDRNYFALLLERCSGDGSLRLSLYQCRRGEHVRLARLPAPAGPLRLAVEGHANEFRFLFAGSEAPWLPLCTEADASFLTRENAGGFTGSMLGLYGFSRRGGAFADYRWFEYRGLEG